MASFQAKARWKSQRKNENKNYRSNQFLPDLLQRIPKKVVKNFKKLKNTTMASFPAKTSWDRLKMGEKMKIVVLINSYPSCNREFQKNSKKIQKTKKYHSSFFSSQNRLEKAKKERK